MARKTITILKIKISGTERSEVLKLAISETLRRASGAQSVSNLKPFYIVTPNPEIVNHAQKDQTLREILNSADLSLPDGIGIVAANKFLSLPTPRGQAPIKSGQVAKFAKLLVCLGQAIKVGLSIPFNRKWLESDLKVLPGRVIFKELVKIAAEKNMRIFLLGSKPRIASQAAKNLYTKYHILNTKYSSGPLLNQDGTPVSQAEEKKDQEALKMINRFRPHFLFVAFGPPKQEKWVARNLNNLNCGVIMVIGGTLDYFAGRAPFPPKLFEKLGLEWLWRLITQPWRLKRILTAVIIFPLKVYWYKVTH